MMLKLLRERRPQGLAVVFDSPVPTARHTLFEAYKAHRPETPDELRQQLPPIRQMLQALRVKLLEVPGYEADDVMATLAKALTREGHRVFLVSADKDMLQVLSRDVKLYDPMKDAVLDARYVKERFGVPPERIPEVMALMGDAIDNIPGVKGIGEKTAKALLKDRSLRELLRHPETIGPERLRRLVSQHIQDIELSWRLAQIDTQVPLKVRPQELALKEPDWPGLMALFREYEFTSLMKLAPAGPPPGLRSRQARDPGELRPLGGRPLGLHVLSSHRRPLRAKALGVALCAQPGESLYVPLEGQFQEPLRGLLGEPTPKVGHDLKQALLLLGTLEGTLLDVMIAAHLLNPLRSDYSLQSLGLEHLGQKLLPKEQDGPRHACHAAHMVMELKGVLFDRLGQEGLWQYYLKYEEPLIRVLARMEAAGVKVDTAELRAFSEELQRQLQALQASIFALAGGEFNINSPRQLAQVLFERLGLKPSKRKKTGYSTDMGVLQELAKEHELPRQLLRWRSLQKLKTTYVDVLPQLVEPSTGRIHSSFNQAATATGRLSSSEPNLQNIPIRGPLGQRMRRAFVAEPGFLLISADYSQIELRVLAHLSQDETLIELFKQEADVHAATAAELFGVSPSAVSPEQRRLAKGVNFGIIYGITPYGLGEALELSPSEAAQYIERYFQRHPGVRRYLQEVVREATEKGYVCTLGGRRRPVPELRSADRRQRALGERLAMNSPVQGTAAEIMKLAMLNADRALRTTGARLILQVHDELLVECPEAEVHRVGPLLRQALEQAAQLAVPLKVELSWGRNWAQAH
jgi:DNA polymerase-1